MKKVLYIREMMAELPDDFDGSLGDAFKLIAEYRKQMENEGKFGTVGGNDIDADFSNGHKVSMQYCFAENKDDDWHTYIFNEMGEKEYTT